jgi:hypothetical protein
MAIVYSLYLNQNKELAFIYLFTHEQVEIGRLGNANQGSCFTGVLFVCPNMYTPRVSIVRGLRI